MRCSSSAASCSRPSLWASSARTESSRIAVRMSLMLSGCTRLRAGYPDQRGPNTNCLSATEQLVAQPYHRIVFPVGHAFLHWDQRVVGDLDAFRADFGAALGDVAISEAVLFLRLVAPVEGVQRMHL